MRYLLTTRAVWKISKLFPIHIKEKTESSLVIILSSFFQIKLNYCAEAWFRQSVTASRILPLDSVQPRDRVDVDGVFRNDRPLADR